MIGNFIRNIRTAQKIRVADIADFCGVSQPYITNVENEKRIPTVEMFFNIIEAIASQYPVTDEILDSFDLGSYIKTEFEDTDDYNNYEIYEDPIHAKELVTSFWIESFLFDFLDYSGYYDFYKIFNNDKEKAIEEVLGLVSNSKSELNIVATIFSLYNKNETEEYFKQYTPPTTIVKSDFIDLSLLDIDDIQKDGRIILDGMKITKSDLASLRKIINGIRYDRLN